MTPEYEVFAKDQVGNILGYFHAEHDCDLSLYDYVQSLWLVQPAAYHEVGVVHDFVIYKNGTHYAIVKCEIKFAVVKGQSEEGRIWIKKQELIQIREKPVCTCGGWAVYGKEADIHADNVANTCDLRKR